MAKKSVRHVSRKPIYIILGLSLVLAIGFAIWQSTRPAPIQIMAIDPVPVTYGNTTLTGTIQKDAPVGEDGNFILVLSDMRVVTLDVQGIDSLINMQASVQGNLDSTMTMTVQSITINQ